MRVLVSRRQVLAGFSLAVPALACSRAGAQAQSRLERVVTEVVRPVMEENKIPGMAVAVTARGKRHVFYFGVASKESGQLVGPETLFEIGSISKTFTATLACYAEARGALSLSDRAGKHLPDLAGSALENASLLELATYTAGGLPLQFPRTVTDRKTMIAYFRSWRPTHAAGLYRVYSNPSIGLLGDLAARSLGKPFEELMEETLFPMLGLSRTHLRVPPDRRGHYAFGYSKAGKPVRVTPGVLDSQAYGVKTTAADMMRFVEVNMSGSEVDDALRRAIAATHTAYYEVGGMRQGLGWEMYADPTDLGRLLAGNSPDMALKANKVTKLAPPVPPGSDVLINKTGSTNGFGAYAAFVPARGIGIALLANKTYPNPARVEAAYRILMALDGPAGPPSAVE